MASPYLYGATPCPVDRMAVHDDDEFCSAYGWSCDDQYDRMVTDEQYTDDESLVDGYGDPTTDHLSQRIHAAAVMGAV